MAQILSHDWFPETLPENVTVGEGSWIYSSFAFLHYQSHRPSGVRIGKSSGIYAGTFFDLGPDGEVIIGDYCTLVGAIISSNSRVEIGDYSFIAHEVVIADSGFAKPCPQAKSQQRIQIGQNAWIGAGAILLQGARIGNGAIVGASTVINFEVPDYAIVAGNPAKIRGWAHS